jgi:Photoprotection regulator fluorescence recovery protein
MMFHDLKWSPSEKKIARRAFDTAQDAALAKVMAEFKEKSAAATTPGEMWEIEDFLRQKRREFEEMFDYRYSQLPLVFARLIHERYLDETLLDRLSGEKREIIRSYITLAAKAAAGR